MALKIKSTVKAPEARWFDYDDETKVLLNPIDFEAYQVALARYRRLVARNDDLFSEGQVGVVEGEKTEYDNLCELLAKFILKDWRGAEDESGNPLSYSEENGAEMLRGNVQFFQFIGRKANEFAKDSQAELKDIKEKQ